MNVKIFSKFNQLHVHTKKCCIIQVSLKNLAIVQNSKCKSRWWKG